MQNPANIVNVARHLPAMAEAKPDHPAARVPTGTAGDGAIQYRERSFAQLDAASDAAALHFQSRGITRGTRTLLMVKPGLELILTTFALFKAGAVPIVIDPGMGLRGFRRCVRRSQPEALVGVSLAQWIARFFPGSFKSVKKRVAVTGTFEDKLNAYMGQPFPLAATAAGDAAAILFTSGSTGPAKGVVYEHGMFEAQVRLIRSHYGIEPGEVDLPMLPVFALFNPAMGMTTVVPEMNPSRPATADPKRIVRAIQQNGVTNSFGSPVLWGRIADHCERAGQTLPSLRRVLCAGAPVPPRLIRRLKPLLPNGDIHTPYGATESLPVSSISGAEVLEGTWRRTLEGAGTCVGGLMPEIEVRVIAVDDGPLESFDKAELLPPGEIGEILVAGPVATKAYDALPEETGKAKIHDDGGRTWHRMGDLGYLDDAGRLWFCGRKAERVETGEGRLPTEICEPAFNEHPRVHRSALVGVGERHRQTPVLCVQPRGGDFPASSAEREAFARELLELARGKEHTAAVKSFSFWKRFPVDVRHNAKIHRLSMAKELERNPEKIIKP